MSKTSHLGGGVGTVGGLKSSTLLPKLTNAAVRHRGSIDPMGATTTTQESNFASYSATNNNSNLGSGGLMPFSTIPASYARDSQRISRQLSSTTPKKLKRLTESKQLGQVKDLLRQSKKDIDQLLIQNWLENELDGVNPTSDFDHAAHGGVVGSTGGAEPGAKSLSQPQQQHQLKGEAKRLVYSQIDLVRAGLSHETAQRAQRALYVYAVGFCDVLKELTSHCDARQSLVANLWSAFIVIAEKMMQMHFHSEFLTSLKAQHKALAKCNSLKQHMQQLKGEKTQTDAEMSQFQAELDRSNEQNTLLSNQVISLKKALDNERDQTNGILRRYTREAERVQELQQIVYRLEGENENLLQRERKILKTARQSEYKYLEKEEVASNAHQKAERMQTENESLHAEIESLRVLAQELEHSNRELKRSNVAQHELFEEESKTRIKLQNDLVHYRDLYSSEEAKNMSLTNELAHITTMSHQATCSLQDVEQAKERLEENMREASDSLSQANLDIEQLTQELKNSREKSAVLEVELEETAINLARVTSNLKMKEEDIVKLETEHAKTLRQLDKANAEVNESHNLLNSSGVAMAVFFKHVDNQRRVSHSLYGSKKSLEKQYFSLKRDAERKSRKLQQLNHELSQKNSQLEDLQKQRVDLTNQIDSLCKKEEEILLKTTKLKNELSDKNAELQKVSLDLDNEINKSSTLEKKASVLQGSNRDMSEELSSVKKHMQTLSIDLGKAEASRAQLQNNLSKVEHKLVTSETQLESNEQEMEKLLENCKEVDGKLKLLGEEHDNLKQERDSLLEAKQESSTKLAELEKQSVKIREDLEKSEKKRQQASDFGKEYEVKSKELEGMLESSKLELEEVKKDRAEVRDHLENKHSELLERYNVVSKEKDELSEGLSSEKEANAKLIDDKETAEKMLRQAQAVRTFLQDEITALKNKSAEMKKQVISESERARHYQQLVKKLQNGEIIDGEESLSVQLEDAKAKLLEKDDEMMKEARQYEEKIRAEKEKVENMRLEVESAQGFVRILEQQIEEMSSLGKDASPQKDESMSPKMTQENFVPSYQQSGNEVGNLYNLLLSPEPLSWTAISQLLLKTRGKNHAVSWLSQKEAVSFNKDLVNSLIMHLFVSWTTTAGRAWVDQNPAARETSSWLDMQFLPNITSHTYDYMLSRFGIIALAESCLRALSSSVCKQASKGDKRCYVFARLTCLDPSAYSSKDGEKKTSMDAIMEGNHAQNSLCKWLAIVMCQLWWKPSSITIQEETGKVLVPYDAARSIVTDQIQACGETVIEEILENYNKEVQIIKLPDSEEEFADVDEVLYTAVMAWDEQIQIQAQKVIDLYISRGLTQHMLSQNEFIVILKHSFRALFDQPMGKLSLPPEVTIASLYRDAIKSSKFSDHVTPDAFASLLCQFGWIRVNVPESVQEKVNDLSLENTKVAYSFEELRLLQDVWNTMQTPLSDASKLGYITPEEVESFARLLVQKATSSPIWQLFRRILNKWWINSLKDH